MPGGKIGFEEGLPTKVRETEVAQDPKIKKLDNGKWRMRWNNGAKSFTADTRDEVVAFKAALLANGMVDPRTIVAPTPGGRTFKQVGDEYIVAKRAKVKPGTLDGYRRDLRLYAYPVIGGMDINAVSPADVRKVITRMRVKGLMESSICKAHAAVLHPVFGWAIRNEWRDRVNPCEVTSEELARKIDEQPIVMPADAPTVLEAAYAVSPDWGGFCTLLYGTGLRWQEACVITAGAVDWDLRVLVVRQVERAKVGIATDQGKSAGAFRDIPLSADDTDPLVVMLRRCCEGKKPGAFLFTGVRGGRLPKTAARKALKAMRAVLAEQHGYTEPITLHAFRRGFGTALEDRAIPEGSLKLVLGHVSHQGATARYVRLTPQQVENIRPFMHGLSWRASQLDPDAHSKAA